MISRILQGRIRRAGSARLHLGCFDQPVEGWINTDVTPHLLVARVPGAAKVLGRVNLLSEIRRRQHMAGTFRRVDYLDVGRRFPYASSSFEAIFSAHMLEHLPPAVAANCLAECLRVLKPGGVMRVGVPDLDLWVENYDRNDPDTFVDAIFEIRQNGGKNRHHWMYNETSLVRTLLGIGFTKVARREYRQGECPDIDVLDNRPDETLFVEAAK